MIPNIFISSTISDLKYLRDAVRETIEELGYTPVMSEYGDIGFIPSGTAEDSCYSTIGDCQLMILIVGKRYGSKSKNKFSITQNELRTAHNYKIPSICLVDREVISFKRIYDNELNDIETFPGMDSPEDTFAFLNEIMENSLNNAILEFHNVAEAKGHLKRQLAHLFGDLLIRHYKPIKARLRNAFEVKTLKGKDQIRYMKAIRLLVDPNDETGFFEYGKLIDAIFDNQMELGIPEAMNAPSFKEFMKNIGVKIEFAKNNWAEIRKKYNYSGKIVMSAVLPDYDPQEKTYRWAAVEPRHIVMDRLVPNYYDYLHKKLLEMVKNRR